MLFEYQLQITGDNNFSPGKNNILNLGSKKNTNSTIKTLIKFKSEINKKSIEI